MFAASENTHTVGTETIGGVSTIHYQGTYSVPEALAELDGVERAQAQQIFAHVGAGNVSFDLWVDGQELPRRLRVVTPASDKVHWDMTTTYTGFDEPVSIAPPPASEVAIGRWARRVPRVSPAR